jgi:hypothetical protein
MAENGAPGGGSAGAGGEGGGSGGGGGGGSGSVSYDTYSKVLDEKKAADRKLQALSTELEQIQAWRKQKEDEELAASKKFEELAKKKDEELAAERKRIADLTASQAKRDKKDAFVTLMGVQPEARWATLIESQLDKISIDANGRPDEASVKTVVDAFRKDFPEAFGKGNVPPPPNGKAGEPGGNLTQEQWNALPLAEKRKRLKDVVGAQK